MGDKKEKKKAKKKEKKEKKREKKQSKKRKHEGSHRETEEQRQARKARKSQKRIQASFGYTNDTNPFNDPNLSAPFVWAKKESSAPPPLADDGKVLEGGRTSKEKGQAERFAEIEKVRKRRQEREQEKIAQENLREEEERLRASMEYVDWERKEREFHLSQMEKRTQARLAGGRETLVDTLAKNYFVWQRAAIAAEVAARGGANSVSGRRFLIRANEAGEDAAPIEVERMLPTRSFDGLSAKELRKLAAEIAERVDLVESADRSDEGDAVPGTGVNSAPVGPPKVTVSKSAGVQYWRDLRTLSAAALATALERSGGHSGSGSSSGGSGSGSGAGAGSGGRIHSHVRKKVVEMFAGKNLAALDDAQAEVDASIAAAAEGVDVEYFGVVLKEIECGRARARLRAFHRAALRARLAQLEAEHGALAEENAAAAAAETAGESEELLADVDIDADAAGAEGTAPDDEGEFILFTADISCESATHNLTRSPSHLWSIFHCAKRRKRRREAAHRAPPRVRARERHRCGLLLRLWHFRRCEPELDGVR